MAQIINIMNRGLRRIMPSSYWLIEGTVGLKPISYPRPLSMSGDKKKGDELEVKDVAAFKKRWEDILRTNEVPEPSLSVEQIVDHVMKKGTILSPSQITEATEMLNQRLKRVRMEYILGECTFRNMTLATRPPVFVPSAKTSELVGHVVRDLSKWSSRPGYDPQSPIKVLDLGCGNGAIAVSILHEYPQAEVVAADISSEAVDLTRENGERNGVSDRLTVLNMSIHEVARHFTQKAISFDCLVSNPPYLTSEEVTVLRPELVNHVDRRALLGGKEGMDFAVEILSTCKQYLHPEHSHVWLEFRHVDLDHVHSLLRLNPQWGLQYLNHHDYLQGSHVKTSFIQLEVKS